MLMEVSTKVESLMIYGMEKEYTIIQMETHI